DRDNITAKLGWVGLGHDDIFPVKTKLHRSGVKQTEGSPAWPKAISRIERGATQDRVLSERYRAWLGEQPKVSA
ncbi:hypothetical protein, partial [Cryobacterium flavum]